MVIAEQSPRPVVSSIIRILIPATILTAAFQIGLHGSIHLPELLLYRNFFGLPSGYWFIQVLVQCLLFLALLFWFAPVRRFAAERAFDFGIILLGFSALLMLTAPFDSIPDQRNWHLPQFRLWQFAIGWCIYFSDTPIRRIIATYTLCVFVAFEYWLVQKGVGVGYAVVTVALGLVLLHVPRIFLVKPLQHFAYALAGASLFIYLLHLPIALAIAYFGFSVQELPALHVLGSLVVGYLFWRCWEFLWTRFGRASSQEPL